MLTTRILALPAETSQIPDLHLQHSTSHPHLDILHTSHNLMLKIQLFSPQSAILLFSILVNGIGTSLITQVKKLEVTLVSLLVLSTHVQ